MKEPACEVAALCDVYEPYLLRDRSKVDPRYLKDRPGQVPKMGEKFSNKATYYNDYRKLLEDKSIDAVCIATPDHWHAIQMIDAVMERLSAIHKAIGHYRTPHTDSGKLPYYFDANGRYEKKETLLKLIDHAKKIGAMEQIAIIEEPFPEELEVDVNDIPIRLAADESAHTDKDAIMRIEMGYKAIALKAIAKTLSMTMKMANVAKERGVPCFCADLTVNPILIDWNKNIAARLDAFPGLGTGLIETNGHQNYKNWTSMESYHPYKDAAWRKTQDGVFHLNDDFYLKSGGVLTDSKHYMELFKP